MKMGLSLKSRHQLRFGVIIMIFFLVVSFPSCDTFDGGKADEADHQVFILCEGNFGYANASLWALSSDLKTQSGPIHWTQGAESENPLGDVGQNLSIYDERLYIVLNNSHSIAVMDIAGPEAIFLDRLNIPGSSPRDAAVRDSLIYISSWEHHAVLIYELDSYMPVDTILLGESRQPENLLINDGQLFVTIKQYSDWSNGHELMRYDITEDGSLELERIFDVCEGPGEMLLHGNKLYVAGNAYDAYWNSYAGLSVLDLNDDGIQTVNYGQVVNGVADLFLLNGKVYRTFNNSYLAIDESLQPVPDERAPVLDGLYTVNSYQGKIIAAATDYAADNRIYVYDDSGNKLDEFFTGALPADILGK